MGERCIVSNRGHYELRVWHRLLTRRMETTGALPCRAAPYLLRLGREQHLPRQAQHWVFHTTTLGRSFYPARFID